MVQSPAKFHRGPTPLADVIGSVLDPVLARQGFSEASLLLYWDEIAGERLAAVSQPIRLQWPPRGPKREPDRLPEPAALVIRVEGAFALELQHLAPLLIERVNSHLGWRCVGRIALRQGPLLRTAKPQRPRPQGNEVAAGAAAKSATAGIEDDALRDALIRLGTKILLHSHANS